MTEFLSKYLLELNDFSLVKEIGRGAESIVFLYRHKNTGELVAFKQITSKPKTLTFLREIEVLIRANHASIIRIKGFFFDINSLDINPTIVLEYLPNGSLYQAIKANILEPTHKSIIMYGIAMGMSYLHSNKIVHRDLKPGNVLLNEKFEPKIVDFNTSKYLEEENQSLSVQRGTFRYMSPEMLEGNKPSYPTDVWGFSLILYELLTGLDSFASCRFYALVKTIKDGGRPPIPSEYSSQKVVEILERCWKHSPSERPTFNNILTILENPEYLFNGTNLEVFNEYKSKITQYLAPRRDNESQTDPINKFI